MKIFDVLGLVVSLGLFAFSIVGLIVGWRTQGEDYEYMLVPLVISSWGIWASTSLLRKKK